MKDFKNLKLLVLILALMAALTFSQNDSLASTNQQDLSEYFDQAPRTAIISAFGAEMESFKAQATIQRTVVLNGRSVYIGNLGGHKVVMTLSGESMVNAAMVTQALIDHFRIKQIVFSGIAGGVNPTLSIGDVVIPAQWMD